MRCDTWRFHLPQAAQQGIGFRGRGPSCQGCPNLPEPCNQSQLVQGVPHIRDGATFPQGALPAKLPQYSRVQAYPGDSAACHWRGPPPGPTCHRRPQITGDRRGASLRRRPWLYNAFELAFCDVVALRPLKAPPERNRRNHRATHIFSCRRRRRSFVKGAEQCRYLPGTTRVSTPSPGSLTLRNQSKFRPGRGVALPNSTKSASLQYQRSATSCGSRFQSPPRIYGTLHNPARQVCHSSNT